MAETSVELSVVSLCGHSLPHEHAELVDLSWGWQLDLHAVPPDRRPLLRQVCEIALETLDGDRYAGTVIADVIAEDNGFLLLSGIGELPPIASDRRLGAEVAPRAGQPDEGLSGVGELAAWELPVIFSCSHCRATFSSTEELRAHAARHGGRTREERQRLRAA